MATMHRTPRALRRSGRTLSATDEFWFSPAVDGVVPSPRDGEVDADGDGVDDEGDSAMVAVAMPPAHAELLVDEALEAASSVALVGFDHTRDRDGDGDDDGDGPAWPGRPTPPDAKPRGGGGAWLLGSFARLAAEAGTGAGAAAAVGAASATPGGLARVPSAASLASDEDASAASDNDDNDAPPSGTAGGAVRPAVSFAPRVAVQPIPHASDLSPLQQRRMYTSSAEVRRNKARNKIEYRHDGCDWRRAAEEWEMSVDMVTGELVHPAHGPRA